MLPVRNGRTMRQELRQRNVENLFQEPASPGGKFAQVPSRMKTQATPDSPKAAAHRRQRRRNRAATSPFPPPHSFNRPRRRSARPMTPFASQSPDRVSCLHSFGHRPSAGPAGKSLVAAGRRDRCSRRVSLTWVGGDLPSEVRITIRPAPGHRSWVMERGVPSSV